MAWFTYKCPVHAEFRMALPRRSPSVKCPQCQQDSQAILKACSVQVKERLDNGAMARAVERLANIEELMAERSQAHQPLPEDENE